MHRYLRHAGLGFGRIAKTVARVVPTAEGDGYQMSAEGNRQLERVLEAIASSDQRQAIKGAFRVGIR